MIIRQFVLTLDEHPIWKLWNSIQVIDDSILWWIMMKQSPSYKKKLIYALLCEPEIKELYAIINTLPVQHNWLSLAWCLNKACEWLINNIQADDNRKDIYFDVLEDTTKIHRDLIYNYYQWYKKVMQKWHINYNNLLDSSFENLKK
jgi:hypothetical protein